MGHEGRQPGDVGRDDRRQLEERAQVLRQREARQQQEEEAAARQQARAVAAGERRAAKAFVTKAERAERRQAKLAATAARPSAVLAAKGPWGGSREGAGRPQQYMGSESVVAIESLGSSDAR